MQHQMNIDFLTGCSRLHLKPYSFFTSEISFLFTVTGMMAVGFYRQTRTDVQVDCQRTNINVKMIFFLRYENI